MIEEQKKIMLLEEQYADARVRARDAYAEYNRMEENRLNNPLEKDIESDVRIEKLKDYLLSLKVEIEELEEKLGDRAKIFYGDDFVNQIRI